MRESAFWRALRLHTMGFWMRVENSAHPGTPDTWYDNGKGSAWIELKALGTWDGTLGLRPEQRAWAAQYGVSVARTPAWLVVRMPDGDILVFDMLGDLSPATRTGWQARAVLQLGSKEANKWTRLQTFLDTGIG